jgi:hypothetical protein
LALGLAKKIASLSHVERSYSEMKIAISKYQPDWMFIFRTANFFVENDSHDEKGGTMMIMMASLLGI